MCCILRKIPRPAVGLLVIFALLLMGSLPAQAFTDTNATTVLNAFNTTYYSLFSSGMAHYRNNQTGGVSGFWCQAEMIEGAIDAYERTGNPADQTNLTQLINGFSSDNGTNWSWDGYNDDIMWACIAYLRGYQDTSSNVFFNIAKTNFDLVYARGWDTLFGGGLYWSTAKAQKNACVNGPAAIVASLLYRTSGDSTYLIKAQNLYNWEKAVLYNPANGAIYDNIAVDGTISTWSSTYNQGTFVGAADFLGDTTNAVLATTYTMNYLGSPDAGGYNIMIDYGPDNNNSGFNSIGARWIARFMKDRNYQFLYLPWLQANANAAWNHRRTSDNLSWCQWDQQTPAASNLLSWDCISSMVVMQVVPADADVGSPAFTVQPFNQITAAGNSVTLSAFATNGQPINYQWYHENNPVPGATGTNLVLIGVGAADGGNYWVAASNSIASAYSQVAQVILYGVTNPVLAQDAATNYGVAIGFSGINEGFGFGPWVLNTTGGGSYISGDVPPLFGIWNNTANGESTAFRNFVLPLPNGASFTVQLQMNTLDTTANQNGFSLEDANGNALFTYWHQGTDGSNGHYTDANGTGIALGFAYDNGKVDSFKLTLTSATNYTFADLATAKSFSGRLSGAAIGGVIFFRVNGSSTPSNGQDFKFSDLAITVVPVYPSPSALALSAQSQGWCISFAVAPGYTYRVQRAANVTGPWTDIGTLTGPQTGWSQFIDTNSLTGQSFYRTVTP
jgi:predicted alpha-1,6-mannanase (GH76 family)